MRKFFTSIFIAFFGYAAFAQTAVNDSVSVGPGYSNQTFYSLWSGTVLSVDNTNWDLAFNTDNREVAIFVNSKKDVKLYLASNDTTKWNSLDTTIKSVKQYHNSDSSWSYGAFNREAPAGTFDYGWGTYSSTSHEVYASKIYFINYAPGLWKKIIISKHDANYAYTFRYANLDGTNEQVVYLSKANYHTKNFIYFSLTTNTAINREPDYSVYDLIFHQYEQEIPFYYKVVGVQLNRNVKAKKVYPVNDVNAATVGSTVLTKNISAIGSDWKTFDVNNNVWAIEDSTVYFVQDISGAKIWKLIFTGYSGSATGKMYFSKTAYVSGINANTIANLGVYPNPANNQSKITFFAGKSGNIQISVKDITGKELLSQEFAADKGFNESSINTSQLPIGTYIITLIGEAGISNGKLIVNH